MLAQRWVDRPRVDTFDASGRTRQEEGSMKRIRSGLAFALPLALLLGTALVPAPAGAEDTKAPAKPNDRSVEVIKHGKDFIVVVHRPDGSAVIGLVDYPGRDGSGKRTAEPSLDELIKNGKVTYTVTVAPEGTPLAKSIDEKFGNVPLPKNPGDKHGAGQQGKDKPGLKLTRKEKSDLARQSLASAKVMDRIGTALASGPETASENA